MRKKISLNLIVRSISNEKGISEDVVFEAIEEAIIFTTKKKYGELNLDIKINRKNGTYKTCQLLNVVRDPTNIEELNDKLTEIPISQAKKNNPNMKIGDILEKEIKSVNFGRIDTQAAKHIIIQKVKEAETKNLINEFINKKEKILPGIVKKISKDDLIIDLGNNTEGILKKKETISKELFRPGDKIKAYFSNIITTNLSPEFFLSRTCNEMLLELFKIEIPEVNEGIIEIKNIVREPGIKAKVAVRTNDLRLDPIGTCIGIKGSRIQLISNELCGEKIDIILWDKDPIKFLINSLNPIKILYIEIDDKIKTINAVVNKDFLSKIIGKNGQNIKMISKLIGWNINIISNEENVEKNKKEEDYIKNLFMNKLKINEELINLLILEGFTSLEEIAYIPANEISKTLILKIKDFNKIRSKAIEALNSIEIDDFKDLKNINDDIKKKLINEGINSKKDLAELSVDDLVDIVNIDKDHAAKLIMEAREYCFFK